MRHTYILNALITGLCFFQMGGCIFSSVSRSASSTTNAAIAPRLQAKLVANEMAVFAKSPYPRAYLLLSEGGMVDQGQIVIFTDDKGQSGIVRHYPPATRQNPKERQVTGTELAPLLGAVEAARSLKDYDEKSFDGIIFEYFAIRKTGQSGLDVDKTLYMRNPGLDGSKAYDGLIAAFKKIAGA